jgi:hypothetical protein
MLLLLYKDRQCSCNLCGTSEFCREVDENCGLLGHYAASSGHFLPKFRCNLVVPSTKNRGFLLTYLLTPWSGVLLEKLTVLQLVKKFPAFYETRRFITAFSEPALYGLLTFHVPNFKSLFCWRACLLREASPRNPPPPPPRRSKCGSNLPPDCFVSRGSISHMFFVTKFFFDGQELLAPRPNPKLDGHPVSAVRDCFFNIFAVTFHIGGRSSIQNTRTRHAVVTGPTYHGSWILNP